MMIRNSQPSSTKSNLIKKSNQTIDRILDSAEALFIEHGFSGTPLRMITDKANANLASVNYYFGSKEALLLEVFNRRFIPYIEAVRKRLLSYGLEGGYTVQNIVATLLIPLHDLIDKNGSEHSVMFIKLCSRILIEHPQIISAFIQTTLTDEVVQYLYKLLQPLLPSVSQEEISWRLYFSIKSIFSAYNGLDVFGVHNSHPDRLGSINTISHFLIPFLTASLSAPPMAELE